MVFPAKRDDLRTILTKLVLWTLVFSVIFLSFYHSKFNFIELIRGISATFSILIEMYPPDFSGLRHILLLLLETLSMGIISTVIGTFISFFISLLASRNLNTTPLYYPTRALIAFFRSVPELMYALLFVLSIGMGPTAGACALIFSTVGILSKFFSEAIESVDRGQVEAVRATGSNLVGVIRYGIFPQVSPLFIGYILYLLDHNIRVAMILGIVGAGGLGVELISQMRTFNYPKVAAILIVIYIVISLIDFICSYLAGKIIRGTYGKGKYIYLDYALPVLLFIFLPIFSVIFTAFDPVRVLSSFSRIFDLIPQFFRPDFSNLNRDLLLMVETVGMAITGTVLAIVLAVPLGIFSARNIVTIPVLWRVFREISNFLRAIPDVVFAILFMAAVGPGPFAGVLAIGLHTAGFLGKFYAEAIENVNLGVIEAVRAVGARSLQVLRYGFFPQIIPLFNSYNLYLLDRNVRVATVMGIVGAGGIGFELVMSVKLFELSRASALIVLIVTTILLFDFLSSYFRKKIV